tara:strand:+ start:3251 stop:3859 length:609 start_codon:yes stop_codon:yes gene_type:complete
MSQNIDLPMEYLQNSASGKNMIPDNVIGSPYFNETWTFGTVYINETSYNRELRYNAYTDDLEMKEKGEIINLLKRDYIWAKIDKNTYRIEEYAENGNQTKQGYFIELNEGKARLLTKKQKELMAAQAAKSSYQSDKPARFIEEESYYLKVDKGPAIEIKLKEKDILDILDKEDQLKAYIKANKLNLKSQEEVIQLLNHYNSL